MTKITVFRGDTIELDLQLVHPETNLPIDITNRLINFYCKHSHLDLDDRAFIKKSSLPNGGIVKTEPTLGKLRVDIAPIETALLPSPYALVYSVVITDTLNRTFTLITDILQIIST